MPRTRAWLVAAYTDRGPVEHDWGLYLAKAGLDKEEAAHFERAAVARAALAKFGASR
jgi:hypothetical protein